VKYFLILVKSHCYSESEGSEIRAVKRSIPSVYENCW
jgi:hypothetical protein